MTDHNLAARVSDVLALERNVHVSLAAQAADNEVTTFEDVSGIVSRLSAACAQHIEALRGDLEQLGEHEGSPLKSTMSGIGGALTGVIERVRKTKAATALRDDHAMLARCIIGYAELIAAANAYDNTTVAALAQRHLQDYASIITEIGECVSGVVVRELRDLGCAVESATAEASRQMISQAWQRAAR